MTPEEIHQLYLDVKKAVKNCPPWPRVCVGVDGKVYVYAYTPKRMFGEPSDGTLFPGEA